MNEKKNECLTIKIETIMKANFNIAKNVRNSHSISASDAFRKLHGIGLIVIALLMGSMQVLGTDFEWTFPLSTTTNDWISDDDDQDGSLILLTSAGNISGSSWTHRTGEGSHINVGDGGYFQISVPISSATTSFTIQAEIYGWKSGKYAAKDVELTYFTSKKDDAEVDICDGATTTSGCYSVDETVSLTSAYTEDDGTLYIFIAPAAGNIGFESLSVSTSAGGTTYTVTYNLNGGSGTTPTESNKASGATFALHNGTTNITAPSGKMFSKWRDQDSNDFDGGDTYTMPAKNVTLTAQWVDLPNYTITYNAGSGSCATPSWTQTAVNRSTTLPTATPTGTCTGWSFAGWCTSSAGSADENASSPGDILTGSYTPTGNATLYAVYTKSSDGGGGSFDPSDDVDGDFYITNSDQSFYLKHGVYSTSYFYATAAASKSEANNLFHITKNGSGKFIISYDNSGTTTYLRVYTSSGNNYCSTTTDSNSATQFTIGATSTANANGTYEVTYNGTRGLMYRHQASSPTDRFGNYAVSNAATSGYSLIEFESAGTLYYMTSLVCASCTAAPSSISSAGTNSITCDGVTLTCAGIGSLGSAGCVITSHGFVIGTDANPTLGNSLKTGKTYQAGTSIAASTAFQNVVISGDLAAGTTYHVRSYATNGYDTGYGSDVTFTTHSTISPTLTYAANTVKVGRTVAVSSLSGNTGSGAVTYSIISGGSYASIDPGTGLVTGTAAGSVTVKATIAAAGNYCAGEATANITVQEMSYTNYRTSCGYTITYECNGAGSGCPDNVEKTFNLPNPLPTTPTKTGYDFAGWYTNEGLTDAAVAGDDIDEDVTLYAKWTAKEYTASNNLHKNGGDAHGQYTATYDATTIAINTAPTRTGYTVEGYYEEAGCTNKVATAAGVLQADKTYTDGSSKWIATSAPTLYTNWTAKSCTVNFDKQDGTGGDNSVTATYGSAMPAITAPTKDGYTFAGYWDEVGGGGTQYYYSTGSSVRNWNKDRTEAISLYAKWTQSVELDKNGGNKKGSTTATYNVGGPLTVNTVPTRTGYTVEGYYAESGCEHKVMTDAGVLVNYSGWVEDGKWVHSGASTLYTKWTENTHTVTVEAGANGSASPASVSGVGITTASGDITATPNTGYHFVNWTWDDGITAASTYSATSNPIHINATADGLTITANFAVSSYVVTLNTNGGTINAGDVTSYTYGVGATLPTNVTKTGYTFGGWYDNSGLTGDAVTTISTSATGDKEFWAKWTPITYSVQFNKNDEGATGTMSNQGFTYDVAQNLTANAFSKTGYNFAGWATSAGGDVAYANSESVSNLSSTQDAVVDLFAKWTAKEITITWNPNGDGASVTPTSSSYTYDGSTVDLPTPTRALHAFEGWYTEAEGGTEITEVGTTNKPTEDVEYFAHWRALTFEVKDQAGTGTADIHLTSTSGVTVYATSGCGNLITIKANNLDIIGNKQNIQIKYLDANNGDAEVTGTDRVFRLCNNGSSNYNVADGSNINLNGLTEYSQTYSISYTPSGYGKVDHYKLQLRLQNNTTEAMTITFDLYGRALPKEFVIAAKSGDNWYALPNTLAGTQDAQGAITPEDITSLVDNTTTPTKVTNPDGTATYGATGRYTAANVSGIRFTNDGSHYIQISSTSSNYKMWLSGSGGANVQDWYLKSSNFGAYEVFMDPIGSPSETRRIELYTSSGVKMGHHGTRGTPNIYLLPVEYSKVDDDMSEPSIMEWGTDHVVMELRNSGLAYSYKTQVGGGALSDATELYTVRKDAGVYRLPITLATADAAKELKISFYRSNDAANGVFSFTVPVMISADDAATSSIAAATAAQCDLVVLNGGVLTVSETTSGAKKTFRDLYIYGGGKMVVPTGTYVDFSNVYMRGGHLNASWQYQYSNPQLVLNGTMGNASNTINYDYLTNNAQFYSLALPYPVKLKDIVNPYFNNKQSWEIHAYNGRERSTGGTGWYDVEVGTGVAPNRINGLGADDALSVGVGYTFWGAMQKVNGTRQLWSVNRFKMPLASGTAEAEKFALDDGVDVKAYGMTYDEDLGEYVYDENVRKNNAGWNMVGNPFLANINGSEDLESDMEAIIIDHHEEKVLDDKGKWTGQMKWVENEEGVRYVRIPYDNGENYHQVRFKDTTFRAFHHFFIQVAVNGKFRLEKKYRAQLAPRRAKATGAALPAEMDIDFILRSSNDKTSFGLTVNDAFVTTFRAGEDMPDELGGVNMKAYTLAGDDRLSYNGLPSDAAEQLIPVGYRAQTAGSHTISHKPGRYDDYIEHIWLTDYVLGQTVDLLYGAYEFTTDAGVIDDRFALNVVFSRNYVPTDIDEVKYDDADEQPIKFIYDDKMFIRYKSVLYDATGKKVGEVRKTK